MAERLAAVLRDASTSPSRAIEAVKHLLTLQADGARCVADCDPLGLYLDAQARRSTANQKMISLLIQGSRNTIIKCTLTRTCQRHQTEEEGTEESNTQL